MEPERDLNPIAVIDVLEIAPPARRLVKEVMAGLSRRVAVPCRLRSLDSLHARIEIPHIPGRNQADADRLLARLEELPTEPGRVWVGLTGKDIGNPIFTHFFGRARHGGSAAIVSAARLTPVFYGLADDVDLTAHRTTLEMLHEIGHVAGLGHCEDYGCVMRFAPSVEQIDNRGQTFCDVCSEGLPPALAPSRADRH